MRQGSPEEHRVCRGGRGLRGGAVLLGVAAWAGLASGVVVTTEHGIEFVTIGAPGNRDTLPDEAPGNPELRVGGVADEYRLSRSEITTRQWLGFVEAYAPYYQGHPGNAQLTSLNIVRSGSQYQILAGTEDWPVEIPWRMAARYCNWLHNGQSTDPGAFESGAYDTSTFGMTPQGLATDQPHHSPGARFWIPTLDEWYKGVYFDPDRYGPGEEGYWLHPGSSNDELISGLPEWSGSQTNAGWEVPVGPLGMAAGSYPATQTPWGLLDASGGASEMSEDFPGEALGWTPNHRFQMGSWYREPAYGVFDRLDWGPRTASLDLISGGLRVAALPAPGSLAVFVVFTIFHNRRSRP